MRTGFVARWLVALALVLVPLRIVAQGYLPADDALRHAAKAVSGRPWSEILVLRPEVTMDSHPGWHALLGLVHRLSGADAHGLVLFSIVALQLALLLPPVFLMRRPEAWALALVAFGAVETRIPARFFIGRPLLLSAAWTLVLCLLALRRDEPRPSRRMLAALALGFGLVSWMHPSWYLFLLLVPACVLGGRRALAGAVAAGLLLGVLIAGVLYGNPVVFAWQSVLHPVLALGTGGGIGGFATEFMPYDGSGPLVLAAALLLLWRRVRGDWEPRAVVNPVLALAALGWLLGWYVSRFWTDWGAVALLAWMAIEIERMLEPVLAGEDRRRLLVAAAGGLAALLVLSANVQGLRLATDRPYLALTGAAAGEALPGPGGIVYTDDMRVFYQLFYHEPDAPWRYLVGYEPALMPPDDFATYRRVTALRTPASYEPWVRKMRPQDRLILMSNQGEPAISGLQWQQVSQTVWSGRVAPKATP